MTITVQNSSEIKAQGLPRNKNAKPVVCLDTGEVFTSVTDAAKSAGAHQSTMVWCLTERQKTCKGKRYCYLSKINEHLDEFMDNVQTMYDKANKYDALMAQKETDVAPVAPESVKADTSTTPTTTATTYVKPKRKASKPLQKAREMVGRANNIIEFFRAI